MKLWMRSMPIPSLILTGIQKIISVSIASRYQKLPLLSWEELLSWIPVSTAPAPSTLKKLAAQSLIYNVWRQRNAAVHLSGFVPIQTIFNSIDRDIRNTITARRHRRKFTPLMQLWIR
ncbi:hypothetical protein Bca52824_031692 [Brassica carinata]|uniref:Uncharacterized protein n=1 Tax=Brassica carinata TaxID=52824 RepID=A0A8X7SB21_BRACI|nr:hypothetical protein Bca52824_031692 [Brassica carinata]